MKNDNYIEKILGCKAFSALTIKKPVRYLPGG